MDFYINVSSSLVYHETTFVYPVSLFCLAYVLYSIRNIPESMNLLLLFYTCIKIDPNKKVTQCEK